MWTSDVGRTVGRPTDSLTRAEALAEVEALARDALIRIVTESGLGVADLTLLARPSGALELYDEDDAIVAAARCAAGAAGEKDEAADDAIEVRSGTHGGAARRHLAQLWVVLDAVHATLHDGTKMTQRELWYRLKTTGLFSSPQQVNERVLDACAAISFRCGTPCPREALGITAAPRGSMTGCVTLLPSAAAAAAAVAQPLDASVFQVPGDTEAVRALRFCPRIRARCVLVVEKDSVFRRLVDDRFVERLPCVLVTACGFPDLATRMLVRALVDSLKVPAFALTDYNPHGLCLMLAYKHGTARLALEARACCPSLHWIGLRAADVGAATEEDDASGLPPDAFQPFTARDRAVCAGLRRRPCVARSPALLAEVGAMEERQCKVEIEALYWRGLGSLSAFLERKILRAEVEHAAEATEATDATEAEANDAPSSSSDDDGGCSSGESMAIDVRRRSQRAAALGGGAHGGRLLARGDAAGESAEAEAEEDWLDEGPAEEWDW